DLSKARGPGSTATSTTDLPRSPSRHPPESAVAKFEFNEAGCTFIPGLTIAREDDLDEFAGEFETFAGRINGRSGDVFTQFNNASFEFSDLFAWKITDEADYDRSMWEEATMAVFFLVAVTREWAGAVRDYKSDRQVIIETWKEEERWHQSNLSMGEAAETARENGEELRAPALSGGPEWSTSRAGAVARYKEAFDEHKEIAKGRWDDFQEKAEEVSDKLNEGATEENVRALQER